VRKKLAFFSNMLFIVLCILITLAFSPVGSFWQYALCSDMPFTTAELDINGDKIVSFSEADYFCSVHTNQVTIDGSSCTEYIALKDGTPLKTTCNNTANP